MALKLLRGNNNQAWEQNKDFHGLSLSFFFYFTLSFSQQLLQNKNHKENGVRLKIGRGVQETGKLTRAVKRIPTAVAGQHPDQRAAASQSSRRKVCKKGKGWNGFPGVSY